MPHLALFARSLVALAALALATPVSAAIPDADMQRLLKNPRIPFQYECSAPLTRKFRIENHAAAAQLRKGIESWQACVDAYNARIQAFVALELTDSPGLVAAMSAEQKERYRAALVEVAKAELALLRPRVEAARALMNDAVDDYNSRSAGMGFTDAEFQKIADRFDAYEYDCKPPDPTDAEIGGARRQVFLSLSNRFDECSEASARRTKRFQQAGGDRAAVVPDSEYDRMTPEQQERIDYLMSTMYLYLPARTELRHKTEDEHRNTKKRLDRVGG